MRPPPSLTDYYRPRRARELREEARRLRSWCNAVDAAGAALAVGWLSCVWTLKLQDAWAVPDPWTACQALIPAILLFLLPWFALVSDLETRISGCYEAAGRLDREHAARYGMPRQRERPRPRHRVPITPVELRVIAVLLTCGAAVISTG